MAFLVASRAAVGLDVVEKLALDIVGDAAPFDRRGGVRSFQTRWEGGLFFVGGMEVTSGVLAGLEFVLPFAIFLLAVIVAFALVFGVEQSRDGI